MDITPKMYKVIEKIVQRHFYGACSRQRIEIEDLVQDIAMTAVARAAAGQKSAYNPEKGAWSTWVYLCGRSILSHRAESYATAGRTHVAGSEEDLVWAFYTEPQPPDQRLEACKELEELFEDPILGWSITVDDLLPPKKG